MTKHEVCAAALQLDPAELESLVEDLLTIIDQPEMSISDEELAELERRSKYSNEHPESLIDAEVVLAELRARYTK